jgi:hypothetical protein
VSILYIFFILVFWDGVAPLKKKNILQGEGRCLAWSEQGAQRNSSRGPCTLPLRSKTSYQGRSDQDSFPSHGHCTPITRRPCSEGESRVRATLSSTILETNSGRGILYFVIVSSPGGASIEELLSQLPENVIGSGLNKEDPGRTPTPFCFPSPGTSSEESVKQRCVLSLKQWVLRFS